MAIVSKHIHYKIDEGDEEAQKLREDADSGLRRLTLNFKTEKAFLEFVEKTSLVQLMSKNNITFERPERSISSFF